MTSLQFVIITISALCWLNCRGAEPNKKIGSRIWPWFPNTWKPFPCRDCVVSQWSEWSPCSSPCRGARWRQRRIERFPTCARPCLHELLQEEPCNQFCHNGGTAMPFGFCVCVQNFWGRCCEQGIVK